MYWVKGQYDKHEKHPDIAITKVEAEGIIMWTKHFYKCGYDILVCDSAYRLCFGTSCPPKKKIKGKTTLQPSCRDAAALKDVVTTRNPVERFNAWIKIKYKWFNMYVFVINNK